jgi:hypothetical protein
MDGVSSLDKARCPWCTMDGLARLHVRRSPWCGVDRRCKRAVWHVLPNGRCLQVCLSCLRLRHYRYLHMRVVRTPLS